MMKRILLGVVLLLSLSLLAAVGVVGYVVATENGLQRSLALARDYLPGALQWREATGKLTGPLDLSELSYRQEGGLSMRIGSAALRWRPGQLLSRRLRIDSLSARDIDIHLPPPAEKAEVSAQPLTLPDIRLPVTLDVQALDLENIRIWPWGAEEPIVIEQVRLAAASDNDAVRLLDFGLRAAMAEARIEGSLTPRGNYPLNLHLDWRARHPEYGEFFGGGTVDGDLSKLKIDLDAKGAVKLSVDGVIRDLLTAPDWDLGLKLAADDLAPFSPELAGSPLRASLRSRGKLAAFEVDGAVHASPAQTGPLSLDLKASGNARKLDIHPVIVRLDEHPGNIRLAGVVDWQPLRLDLRGEWRDLSWPLSGEAVYRAPRGTLHLTGSPEDFVARVATALDGRQLGPLRLALDLKGVQKNMQIEKLTLDSPDRDLNLSAKGHFNVADQSFQVSGQWRSLAWPLRGAAQVESPSGRFSASGRLDDYRFELDTEARGPQLPAGHWRLRGQGSDKALSQFRLAGRLLDGTLEASGKLGWQSGLDWDVTLEGKGLNPGSQWPQASGKLGLRVKSSGQLTDQGPDLVASIDRLNGRLRGQPLHGEGRLTLKGDALRLRNVRLRSGKARLELDGELAERWNLKWRLRASRIADLAPDFKGAINARGRLSGSRAQPRASFDLKVSGFSGAGIRLGMLRGSGDIDISGKRRSRLDIHGSDMVAGGQTWRSLSLKGGGKPQRHRLDLALKGEAGVIDLGLRGGLEDQTWIGDLRGLSLRKTDFGDWTLDRPVAIKASRDHAQSGPLCLHSQPTKLCLEGDWDARRGSTGHLRLTALNPGRFEEFLPKGLHVDTLIDGKADARIDARGAIDANAGFDLRPGAIRIDSDVEPVNIALRSGKLLASVRGDKLDAKLDMDLGETGKIEAVTAIADLRQQGRLGGEVVANLNDLSIISAFAPQLQAVEGRLRSDLKLGGTLSAPRIGGELGLTKFAAEIPQVAVKLHDTWLKIHDDGGGALRIDGRARSGPGELALSGKVDPGKRAITLNIEGDQFQVANSRTLKAVISPDLKLALDNQGMRVRGRIVVPSAYINVKSGGGDNIVSASKDVVLVENGEAAAKSQRASKLDLNLRIDLGDDIRVEVADFSGALKGGLRIEQSGNVAPRATGMIEVVNGDYLVYGQQLKIQRGRILFGGGPVDNPRLEIDVARRVEAYNVLAGAKIRGTAQAPRLQLYSEPPMPDASILSYMLLGQPPGTKGGSYTLGKYLTPDLYVGYSIGLFNAINTFNLRYKLTDKLGLQAASGLANSADLVYTIER